MSTQQPRTHTLRLLLGDQLNPEHSWFATQDDGVVYVLMEVRQETDYVLHHAQKILAIFAAMRDLDRHLREAGHRVRYVAMDDASNRQSIPDNLAALMAHYGAHTLQYQHPDEWRLDEQLRTWGAVQAFAVQAVSSEHFYTTRTEMAEVFKGRKQWLMEHFYRRMRQRHSVLIDEAGEPEGGQWNYDHDNRKPWPGTPALPPDARPTHDHSALWATLQAAGVPSFGNPQAHALRWPLNRAEALAWLDHFITTTLQHFGAYEDAMSTKSARLFHSLLSFALNTKMLRPHEVVQSAQAAYRAGTAPLPAVEGFVRQILGWREYVRGIYWAHMPGYDERNALGHNMPLPEWFWTGNTRMRCMQHAVGQSLEHAYAHHIQRLMVIGNFALLAGLEPAAVHRWYLGVYIDAFEWVEVPNTVGMSQFADGGLLATKPYVSSAAYIDRMSDYCKGCHYDKKQKVGERACPYNALYWDFFARNEGTLGNNFRLGLMYRQLQKMRGPQLDALRAHAAGCAVERLPNHSTTPSPQDRAMSQTQPASTPFTSLRSLPEGYRALVIGSTGAIGSAFLAHLQADPRCALAVGLGRHTNPAVDLDDEATIARAAHQLKAQGPWHCIIHAAGLLHGPYGLPEKRLGQLNYAQMEATFRTNTFGPALVLAHFAPLLPKQGRGLLAVLSAKVGSIGDNRLGGWYSYRASKAALNMLVKTASIEVARTHPQAVLVALHPGTVDSALSAPFNGAQIGRPAQDAVADLLRVLDGLSPEASGGFYAYSGAHLPW